MLSLMAQPNNDLDLAAVPSFELPIAAVPSTEHNPSTFLAAVPSIEHEHLTWSSCWSIDNKFGPLVHLGQRQSLSGHDDLFRFDNCSSTTLSLLWLDNEGSSPRSRKLWLCNRLKRWKNNPQFSLSIHIYRHRINKWLAVPYKGTARWIVMEQFPNWNFHFIWIWKINLKYITATMFLHIRARKKDEQEKKDKYSRSSANLIFWHQETETTAKQQYPQCLIQRQERVYDEGADLICLSK